MTAEGTSAPNTAVGAGSAHGNIIKFQAGDPIKQVSLRMNI